MKLFDFQQVLKNIPELLAYLPITLELALLSMAMGLVLGLLLAIIFPVLMLLLTATLKDKKTEA